MTTFLFLMSFALHFAALFAIVLLYLRQTKLMRLEKRQDQIMREMEEFFSAYLLEFKEENARFIAEVKKMDKKEEEAEKKLPPDRFQKESPDVQKPYAADENKPESDALKTTEYEIPAVNFYQAVQAYKQTAQPEEKRGEASQPLLKTASSNARDDEQRDGRKVFYADEVSGPSLPEYAFFLKKQGLSLEEIAKKLNKGITEIELLFKFRQN